MLQHFAFGSRSIAALVAIHVAVGFAACTEVTIEDDDGGMQCEELACELICDGGYEIDAGGCPVCACPDSDCPEPNPAGCTQQSCPPDSVCDTTQGCHPSECLCDAETGAWGCTKDCVGGECVPVSACAPPSPAGCSSLGCDAGKICDVDLGCLPSGCSCDESSGTWGCTADCGGGICVPDPSGCDEPYPGGCFETGCPVDQVCVKTSGVCVPSECFCDGSTGTWACTNDCGGGLCADP